MAMGNGNLLVETTDGQTGLAVFQIWTPDGTCALHNFNLLATFGTIYLNSQFRSVCLDPSDAHRFFALTTLNLLVRFRLEANESDFLERHYREVFPESRRTLAAHTVVCDNAAHVLPAVGGKDVFLVVKWDGSFEWWRDGDSKPHRVCTAPLETRILRVRSLPCNGVVPLPGTVSQGPFFEPAPPPLWIATQVGPQGVPWNGSMGGTTKFYWMDGEQIAAVFWETHFVTQPLKIQARHVVFVDDCVVTWDPYLPSRRWGRVIVWRIQSIPNTFSEGVTRSLAPLCAFPGWGEDGVNAGEPEMLVSSGPPKKVFLIFDDGQIEVLTEFPRNIKLKRFQVSEELQGRQTSAVALQDGTLLLQTPVSEPVFVRWTFSPAQRSLLRLAAEAVGRLYPPDQVATLPSPVPTLLRELLPRRAKTKASWQ